jgi:predicted transcriptional regulator
LTNDYVLQRWQERIMSSAAEKAVEAIELLPEEMREQAAAYLLSQAKKFRALKEAIDEGMADVEAGRVVPWDLEDFLEQARAQVQR